MNASTKLTPSEWWDTLAEENQERIMHEQGYASAIPRASVQIADVPGSIGADFEIEGMKAQVRVSDRSHDGERMALLLIEPAGGCNLEGDEPGSYYLVPPDSDAGPAL